MATPFERCFRTRRTLSVLAVLGLALLTPACTGNSPTTPTPPPTGPTITSVSPASGPTTGGTEITITGSRFDSTATVTVGGVAATNVRTLGTSNIQAVTGAHAAGAVDVVVTVGGSSATSPAAFTYVAPAAPTVSAISPASGSTAGGTAVTITGTNFATGAIVTIGGVAATNVELVSTTTIRAVTGARTAGAADVRVTVGPQTATLAAAFTYVAPALNPLPVITTLAVQGTRSNQPVNFADLGEVVNVTATVVDNETSADQLIFEWTADGGTFTGTGRAVQWRAPTGILTPAQLRITLRVTEVLAGVAGFDAHSVLTQSVTATTTVRLHDSAKEISDLSVQFLLDFSDSKLAPDFVVRNFWDGCPGKKDELGDVQNNRTNYLITSYRISTPTSSTVNFQGTCPFRSKKGDGCVQTPVEWHAIYKPTGLSETSTGTDQTTAVYRDSRWWLCDSDFDGKTTNPVVVVPFIR